MIIFRIENRIEAVDTVKCSIDVGLFMVTTLDML